MPPVRSADTANQYISAVLHEYKVRRAPVRSEDVRTPTLKGVLGGLGNEQQRNPITRTKPKAAAVYCVLAAALILAIGVTTPGRVSALCAATACLYASACRPGEICPTPNNSHSGISARKRMWAKSDTAYLWWGGNRYSVTDPAKFPQGYADAITFEVATGHDGVVPGAKRDKRNKNGTMAIHAADNKDKCLLAVVERHIRANPPAKGQPLFLADDKSPIRTDEISNLIKQAGETYGLKPDQCSAHSLRYGVLQDLIAANATAEEKNNVGPWASDRGRKHYERLAQSAVSKRYRNHIVESTITPDMALLLAGVHDS